VYSTCIFCHTFLGGNESVEHFPIGRRLAFDAARGRLWVVCRKCERWNLTPLEERWEAIEECERAFSSTTMRVSTGHIGLARLREGVELVRIGEPQRPEMAAWRYGDQFGRRRRKHMVYTAAGVAAAGIALTAGQLTGLLVGGSAVLQMTNVVRQLYRARRARVNLVIGGQEKPITVRADNLLNTWIEPIHNGWALNIAHERGRSSPLMTPIETTFRIVDSRSLYDERLTGDEAMHALAVILPVINSRGGSRGQVASAVDMLEQDGDRDKLLQRWVNPRIKVAHAKRMDATPVLRLGSFPRDVLLAFEMATHEEAERRALEGELRILEEMWRQAEEVASIADALVVPDAALDRLDALKESDRKP
jgi:hypothetical protein